MKKVVLFFIIFLFFTFGSLLFARDLTSLKDVDHVGLSCYIKDGVLKGGVIYKNRDTDQLVYWKNGSVRCYYTIYEWKGTSLEGEKGNKILEGDKILSRYAQDFYIDIPSSYIDGESYGLIECFINTNYETFTVSDIFLLKNYK